MCDTNEKLLTKINVHFEKLNSLKSEDYVSRQNVLKQFEKSLLDDSYFKSIPKSDTHLENVKILLGILNDDFEKCRELSAKILNLLFDKIDIEFAASCIIFSLLPRLSRSDEREQSEEVRLLEVNLIFKLISNYDGDLLKHLNDLKIILAACITDDYPEVKRKSCDCVILLTQKQKANFHMISSEILKSLLFTISHQHFRTRALCLKAVGCVVSHGGVEDFENAVPYIAQRLFDHSPIVRTVATEVLGYWLLILPDRYSYFNRLIPLMLSTLYDEVSDIRETGKRLWYAAGKQYILENEADYKDLINFPQLAPENYPEIERPPLGCRILVQRNFFNILSPLLNDLSDWTISTRLKSIKVLYSLILHTEDKATIKLSSFLDGVVHAAKDDEKEIVDIAIHCAELLGFFIDPNLLCDSVMTLLHKTVSAANLSIFAAVLRGHKGRLSNECFQAICKFLSDTSLCRVRQPEEQANLLLCIKGLLSTNSNIDFGATYRIFCILSTVAGLTNNNAVIEKVLELMKDLAVSISSDIKSLFTNHAVPFLKNITSNNEIWTSQSPEMPIFYFLVQSEYVGEEVLELIIPVMINNLNINKDVKLRSQIFTLLIKVFKKFSSVKCNEISDKIVSLIRLGIFPNLSWSPGKAASSLKIVALASLYEIVSQNCMNKQMIQSVADELLPILASLSDDDEVSNRLLSCKILEFLLPKLYSCVDDLKIHSVCQDFLQCIDDGSDDIRILTTRLLTSYIKAFPENYDWTPYRFYLKELYKNTLLHMDDKNLKIQKSVLNFLKEVAYADPQLLLDEIEDKRHLMTSSNLCEELITYIKQLKI